MVYQLDVHFGTISGRDRTLTFSGDLGYVPAPGGTIRMQGNHHLLVRTQTFNAPTGELRITADAPLRPTVQAARNFADDVKTDLIALGMTFVGQS